MSEVESDEVPDEDGYDGAAELIVEGRSVPVEVGLRGHFEPIRGSFRWYGRVSASPELASVLESAPRSVLLRTPHGEADTALSDIDPWGRPRVEGFGTPPFVVLNSIPDGH